MPAHVHGDGDAPAPPAPRGQGILWVGAPPALPPGIAGVAADVADVVEAVQEESGDVLLLTRDAAARRAARAARMALGPERIAVFHVEAPLTAWVLALHLMMPLAPTWPVAQLGGALQTLVQATRTRVALSSLASLEHPAPSFAQYVVSLSPWTTFDVDLSTGIISKATAAMPQSGGPVAVARSAKPVRKDYADWMPGALQLDPAGAGWKARRWCEVTDLVVSDAQITAMLSQLPAHRCPVCDRVGSSPSCLFCDHPLRPPVAEKFGVAV